MEETYLSSMPILILARTFFSQLQNFFENFFKKTIDICFFLSILQNIKQRRFGIQKCIQGAFFFYQK